MKYSPVLAAALFAVLSTGAGAQPRGYGVPYDPSTYYHHASTAQEGASRGLADVVRSTGYRNLLNSQAMLNREAAISARMDNKLKWTRTYYERKRIHDEYVYGTEEEKAERRRKNLEKRLFRYGREGIPKRPTKDQLDPITGKIGWPVVLMSPAYKKHREKLEPMFVERAYSGGSVTYENYNQIKKTTNVMLAILKDNIKTIDSMEYTEAKRFINALVYEAKYPAG